MTALRLSAVALIATASTCAIATPVPPDAPLLGDGGFVQRLDGTAWRISDSSGVHIDVPAVVPGDLLTDLQSAGLIGDPLFGTNFQSTFWDTGNWTYSLVFNADPPIIAASDAFLVFDSVKMAADVALNGQPIGSMDDQFLRYAFPVGALLKPAGNVLSVSFATSQDPRNTPGRFMACSGAWDWAPYTNTTTLAGDRTMSKGIVGAVYLAPVSAAALAHVAPLVRYAGPYPTSPLQDGSAGAFIVTLNITMQAPSAESSFTGVLTAVGSWAPNHTVELPILPSQHGVPGPGGFPGIPTQLTVSLELPPAVGVDLWWPIGLGKQSVYTINVTYMPVGIGPITTSRTVGFRTVFLVTANDSDPSSLAGQQGSDDFTMRLKVNGVNLFARGANVIPQDELEGRVTLEGWQQQLTSAAAAGMNVLRIWGGGTFLPDSVYDLADALGLLLYQDLMYGTDWFGPSEEGHFTGQKGVPSATPQQAAEIFHSVSRLSHHPSIAVWSGGNEWLGYIAPAVFQDFVFPTLLSADDSRPIWPCSPSSGWASGVDRLTGLPLPGTLPVIASSSGKRVIEIHGYYQHGEGFSTVNSSPDIVLFDPNQPPVLPPAAPIGPSQPGVFGSEFGMSVFPSFESLSATLDPADWYAHAPAFVQRNYAADNAIVSFFAPAARVPLDGPASAFALQHASFLSMLATALWLKADVETRRASNQWGQLIWQLGEIWPTGGWGSLEYGPSARWKPLHHWFASHLFLDSMAACGVDARCFVRSDAANGFSGRLQLHVLHVASGAVSSLTSVPVSLPGGGGQLSWLCANGTAAPPGGCAPWSAVLAPLGCAPQAPLDCVVMSSLAGAAPGAPVDEHTILLGAPYQYAVPPANVTAEVGGLGPGGEISVSVSTNATAFFVTLTTVAQGRFSDNAFMLPAGTTRTLRFLPIGDREAARSQLRATLRIDHIGLYTSGAS